MRTEVRLRFVRILAVVVATASMAWAEEPLARFGAADELQEFSSPIAGLGPGGVGVQANCFGQLPSDGEHRVEGGHRLLEDHGDPAAADAPQLGPGESDELRSAEFNASADFGVRG